MSERQAVYELVHKHRNIGHASVGLGKVFCAESLLFAREYGNIIRQYRVILRFIMYALVAQPVEHLTFNQRARDSSSLERTKIPRRIVRFLVGFSFYTPFARSLHGFCTVRIFHVRWSKSVNYSAIRAIFCNSGQQSQAELRFYRGVCVLQKLQKCRYGDGHELQDPNLPNP